MSWFERIIYRNHPSNLARPREEREITEFVNNRRGLSIPERAIDRGIDEKTLPTSAGNGGFGMP